MLLNIYILVKEFENFNLEDIVTPVLAEKLNELLIWSNYDNNKREFLVDGFRNGLNLDTEDL